MSDRHELCLRRRDTRNCLHEVWRNTDSKTKTLRGVLERTWFRNSSSELFKHESKKAQVIGDHPSLKNYTTLCYGSYANNMHSLLQSTAAIDTRIINRFFETHHEGTIILTSCRDFVGSYIPPQFYQMPSKFWN